MDTAKTRILKDTIEKPFDRDRFKKFTRKFFNEPERLPEVRHSRIWREYADDIESYDMVAKYIDREDNCLLVMTVELKRNMSSDRVNRIQRNFISKILEVHHLEAAIVAFYTEGDPNWRLSFVRLDDSFIDKEIILDLTPARRYSYWVGKNEPNYIVQEQLLPVFQDDDSHPTLDEIENAFSIEKLTKEFFKQYQEKYLDLKEYLEQDASFIAETKKIGFTVKQFAEQFAKKLMGQLAFLYFLQKKGWLGVKIMPEAHTISMDSFHMIYNKQDPIHKNVLEKVFKKTQDGNMKLSPEQLSIMDEHEAEILSDCFVGTEYDQPWGSGNRRFIREIFDFCVENTDKNFFNDYLEPFFYDALNKKRKNHYFKRFHCKIPFLNGGLFEPMEGYHWRNVNFEIPNELFSNRKEKGRKADGILDIFDRYNFTINEDKPFEKEVAIDPKMLGEVFENLLDVRDRKTKGAFYTPREVVQYMCQESLIHYLVNEVHVPYKDMKEFILYGEWMSDVDSRREGGYGKAFTIKPSIFDHIVKIDEALKSVKVADPAVGSGAFPLGMLNEIVSARHHITEYMIIKNKEEGFDKGLGESLIRKSRSPYKMKRDTIQNSIFAVDIEPSAVNIAKLRLWLSLAVEQGINDENLELHPLPNLDLNIHVGNSLMDEFEGIRLFDQSILQNKRDKNNSHKNNDPEEQLKIFFDSDEILEAILDKQKQYFEEDHKENKKYFKKRIDQLRDAFIVYKLRESGNQEALYKYHSIKKQKSKPYFIWELEFFNIFKEKGGFDIVIGNPPYVGEKGNKEIFRSIAKTEFGKKYYQGKMDLFYFFFHKGIDICKEGGIIEFITTNYYTTANGATTLRLDIKNRTSVLKLINFNELKIFESALGQHNLITLLKKDSSEEKMDTEIVNIRKSGYIAERKLKNILEKREEGADYFIRSHDRLFDGAEGYMRMIEGVDHQLELILDKISRGIKIDNICYVNQGIVSGADKLTNKHIEKFGIQGEKGEGIFVLNENEAKNKNFEFHEAELLKPFFKSSDISRYQSNARTDKRIIYIDRKLKKIENQYPNIERHFRKYYPVLSQRRETKNGSIEFFHLQWGRNEKIFKGEKIVAPQRSKLNIFAYNNIPWYSSADVYYITPKSNGVELKYLLGILNSKLYYLWFYYRGKRKGETLELYQTPLKKTPVLLSKDKMDEMIRLVDLIITETEENERQLLQSNIDKIVYQIYGLSDLEIQKIENYLSGKAYQGDGSFDIKSRPK